MSGEQFGKRPAFARSSGGTDNPGMDTRTYLAAAALTGYLAFNPGGEPVAQSDADVAARKAVEYADALLAELAKEQS